MNNLCLTLCAIASALLMTPAAAQEENDVMQEMLSAMTERFYLVYEGHAVTGEPMSRDACLRATVAQGQARFICLDHSTGEWWGKRKDGTTGEWVEYQL